MFERSFMRLGVAGAMLLLMGAGCAPIVSKTPVQGAPANVSRLAGEWVGDYSSVESGRRGTITFSLRAGADTAEGDIIMESRPMNDPSAPDAVLPREAARTTREVLSIRFVMVGENDVSGVLDPYKDPACGCTLTTTFRGTIRGNVIEGTFHTEGSGFGHLPQNGRWRVKRTSS